MTCMDKIINPLTLNIRFLKFYIKKPNYSKLHSKQVRLCDEEISNLLLQNANQQGNLIRLQPWQNTQHAILDDHCPMDYPKMARFLYFFSIKQNLK